MSLIGKRDGYYDERGIWQRTKFCFVDCGERCTCKPPFGALFYLNERPDETPEAPESEGGAER